MTRKRSEIKTKKSFKKTLKKHKIEFMILFVLIFFILVSIWLVNSYDPGEEISNNEQSGKWLFAMDTDNVGSIYQASYIPTLAVINPEGNIVYYNSAVHTKDQLLPIIESALEGTAESIGQAPDFTVTTLNDKIFKLSEYQGKVVILDLMAEYCGPCKDQMPELQKIKLEKGDDVVILSIDIAYPNESEELVRDAFEKYIRYD